MAKTNPLITMKIVAELSQMNLLGTGYRGLVKHMMDKYGIKTSYSTIRDKIMIYREENFDIAAELRAEKKDLLRSTVEQDLDLIQHEIDDMIKMQDRFKSKKDSAERRQITDRMIKLVDLRRKYTGFTTPEEEIKDKPKPSAKLFDQLDELVEKRREEARDKKNESN